MFWIVAIILAVAVAATLVMPLLRGAEADARDPATAVYRDQLDEVDRDLARGLLDDGDAERARTEIARRLLDADKARGHEIGTAPRFATVVAAGIAVGVVVIGSLALYDRFGVPGFPDVPRAQRIADSEAFRAGRISQAQAEALAAPGIAAIDEASLPEETRALIDRLREIVPTRPDDLQGWQLLAEHEARLGQFAAAARAQERVVALKGSDATLADRVALVDRMVSAAGGIISPETEAILRLLLDVDEGNAAARYYLGLLYYQTDRPDVALRFWRDLVEQGSADLAHVRLARAGVEDAAFRAGVTYALPPLPTGPDLADADALAQMSPEDRAAMIEAMVARLSDRLATSGGPVEEWARLINAYAVLGDTEQAIAIWQEAISVFGTSPDATALLARVAAAAGLSP